MSVAIAVDLGPKEGLLFATDSGCYSGDMRANDLHKLYATDHVAVAVTGHVRALQHAAAVLADKAVHASIVKAGRDGAAIFAAALETYMQVDGAGGDKWPRDYGCNFILALRDAPPGERLWAACSELTPRLAMHGPGCDHHPTACIGTGSSYALGGWVAASPSSRKHRPKATAARAVEAACALCAWCRGPVAIRHLWAPGI